MYFTLCLVQIYKIIFRGFLFSRIWSSAQDYAVLGLLLNPVMFLISIWQNLSNRNNLYWRCTSLGQGISAGPALKGGPEPLEKEIHEILGSKCEDRFSLFLMWYQKHVKVRFSYLLRHGNFCKGPRTLRKFPKKCQKMAGCWESAV